MKKTAAKAIVVLALLIFAITGCGKAQKTEGQMPGKDTGTQMTANAWESADALKDALQKQYGFLIQTSCRIMRKQSFLTACCMS